MKAITSSKQNGEKCLVVQEREKLTPKKKQVLIKVKGSSVNISDYKEFQEKSGKTKLSIFAGKTKKIKGKVLGGEVSGVIEQVGKKVKNLKIGDEVFAVTTGFPFSKGGWAEYALANEKFTHIKPNTLSFEQSATIPIAAITALGAIKKAKIKSGQSVLIYGASGGVGHFAVQIAKSKGAVVTAVCGTRNVELVQEMGADFVIDYKKENFLECGKKFDAIFGLNGYNKIRDYKKLLNKGGIYVATGGTKQAIMAMLGKLPSLFSSKKVNTTAFPMIDKQSSLCKLTALAESGKLKPHIDNVYPAERANQAIEYIINEHAQGKVAISVDFGKEKL